MEKENAQAGSPVSRASFSYGDFRLWQNSTNRVRLLLSHKLRLIHTILLLSNTHFRNYSVYIYFPPACVFQPRFYVIN